MNAGELRRWVSLCGPTFQGVLKAQAEFAAHHREQHIQGLGSFERYLQSRSVLRAYLCGGLESHDRLVDPDKLNDFLDELEREA